MPAYELKNESINFVIRAKENLKFKRISSRPTDKAKGVLCDQTIRLIGQNSKNRYPAPLRRIKYYDSETDKTFVFLTNNFKIAALTVAALYKCRWGIETFFKWIKQHLKIQTFWGQSENAVRTQIWIAIATYVIVAIAKKKLSLTHSLYEILQLVSLSPFDKTPIKKLFKNEKYQDIKEQYCKQLKMF